MATPTGQCKIGLAGQIMDRYKSYRSLEVRHTTSSNYIFLANPSAVQFLLKKNLNRLEPKERGGYLSKDAVQVLEVRLDKTERHFMNHIINTLLSTARHPKSSSQALTHVTKPMLV